MWLAICALIISSIFAIIGLFTSVYIIIEHLTDPSRRNTHRRPQKR